MSKPAIGTKVIVRPECDPDEKFTGIVFEVDSHQQKNITIKAVGNGALVLRRPVRIGPDMVTGEVPDGYDQHTTETCRMLPLYPLRSEGTVFTVPGGVLPGVTEATLLVVLGSNGKTGGYRAARLGGTKNFSYFPKVAAAAIRPVPLDQVAWWLNNVLA